MLDTRQFLWTDPFSHTKADEVWINHSWLGQLFWAMLFRWGWVSLGLGLATIVTLAFWWVWLACQGNLYIKTFSLILAAISSSIIWAARPQMLSFLLTALVLYLLHRFKQDSVTEIRRTRLLPWFPLIIILWVNLHGGFAIAFILMLCYLVGEAFNLLLPVNQPVHPLPSTNPDQPSSLSWPAWKHLALTFIICLLVVVINPHTWQMWFYLFRTVNIEVLHDFIAEWQSPNFHQPIIQPFLVMLLLLLTVIARSKRQIDWTDLALLGGWLMMSLMAARHIPIFALVATPILVKHATVALETQFGPVRLGNLRPPSRMMNLINWFLLGIIALGPIVQVGGTFSPANLQRAEADRFPVEALAYLREHQPPGLLFNSYNFGGYLMYHLWPDYEIYVDGRTDLYDDMFLRHYLNVILARPGWEIRLLQEQIRLIVIEANAPLALRLTTSTAWHKTYADDQVKIFERR